jgi:pantetheine-phosphate adenylyltransferase
MNTKTGVVAGSFDPITNGHLWIIQEALKLVNILHVTIGHNPGKPGYFTPEERERQVRAVLSDVLPSYDYDRLWIGYHSGFLVQYASSAGADCIIRGIRNSTDFLYEQQLQAVNAKINPSISTIYLIPPNEHLECSSSVVRGLVGFEGWEEIVSKYVHPVVLGHLERKANAQ